MYVYSRITVHYNSTEAHLYSVCRPYERVDERSPVNVEIEILERKRLMDVIFSSNRLASKVSTVRYRISLTEDALKDSTELRKNVKRILEVKVGLLKDRVSASEEPPNKKRRVEEIIKKNNHLELLEQRIADLEGENAELKNENAKLIDDAISKILLCQP
uniref:Uncharacterized protein n=1 Tax=Rhizophagus irregularis (strain DAOM 181602 / DAOM 197198 / MUCL 43194) TaxID=747089 RepID=U9U6Y8_RHIID